MLRAASIRELLEGDGLHGGRCYTLYNRHEEERLERIKHMLLVIVGMKLLEWIVLEEQLR